MDLHHIRYFLAVCETLNFTAAARRCGVTQPALSRAIGDLETEVGGQLFRRERKLTHLTDLAILMRPRFEAALLGLQAAREQGRRFLTMDGAETRLGIMCSIGPRRFTDILHHLQECMPGMSVSLMEGMPMELQTHLEKDGIDLAIMTRPRDFPSSCDALDLYAEEFLVGLPPTHRLCGRASISFNDLSGENYLERLNCEAHAEIEALMEAAGCSVSTIYESDREDWIQNLIAGGLGITILPEFSVMTDGFETRPLADPGLKRTISAVWKRDRAETKSVCRVLELLSEAPASRMV